MINVQLPHPAYMLMQNGQPVFAQPAGGAIFTNSLYPSRSRQGLGFFASQPTPFLAAQQQAMQIDPSWQRDMYISPSYGQTSPMSFVDAEILEAQEATLPVQQSNHLAPQGGFSIAPQGGLPASPVAVQPLAYQPIVQHGDPMQAAREEIARQQAEAAQQGSLYDMSNVVPWRSGRSEGDPPWVIRPSDPSDPWYGAGQGFVPSAPASPSAFAQPAAVQPQLAAPAPAASNNAMLWVALGAAALGVGWWWYGSQKGAAA